MNARRRLASPLVFALVALALGACSSEPTAPSAVVPAAGASYDGGLVFGSGNRSDTTSTNNNSSSTGTTDAERGGLVFGSGN